MNATIGELTENHQQERSEGVEDADAAMQSMLAQRIVHLIGRGTLEMIDREAQELAEFVDKMRNINPADAQWEALLTILEQAQSGSALLTLVLRDPAGLSLRILRLLDGREAGTGLEVATIAKTLKHEVSSVQRSLDRLVQANLIDENVVLGPGNKRGRDYSIKSLGRGVLHDPLYTLVHTQTRPHWRRKPLFKRRTNVLLNYPQLPVFYFCSILKLGPWKASSV